MLKVQILICAYHSENHISDVRALLGDGDLLERDLGEVNDLGLPSPQTVWLAILGRQSDLDAIDKAATWIEKKRANIERLAKEGWEIRISLDLSASDPVSSVVLSNRFLSQLAHHRDIEFEVTVFPQPSTALEYPGS